jgi:hypothetical protein
MWKLIFDVDDIILKFGIPKKKLTNSIEIMPNLKRSKKICFGDNFFEKQTKIATHMDLWKYGQILIIEKLLIIKQLKFSKKNFLIWVYQTK